MPQAVVVAQPGLQGRVLVGFALLVERFPVRDERSIADYPPDLLEERPLAPVGDRDLPIAPTLGPGRFQRQIVAAIGNPDPEFKCLLPAQSEGPLQA